MTTIMKKEVKLVNRRGAKSSIQITNNIIDTTLKRVAYMRIGTVLTKGIYDYARNEYTSDAFKISFMDTTAAQSMLAILK